MRASDRSADNPVRRSLPHAQITPPRRAPPGELLSPRPFSDEAALDTLNLMLSIFATTLQPDFFSLGRAAEAKRLRAYVV